MACRALWNTTSDESFHTDVSAEIDFMYSMIESENKDYECTICMENSLKMNQEKFGLSVSVVLCGRTWTVL